MSTLIITKWQAVGIARQWGLNESKNGLPPSPMTMASPPLRIPHREAPRTENIIPHPSTGWDMVVMDVLRNTSGDWEGWETHCGAPIATTPWIRTGASISCAWSACQSECVGVLPSTGLRWRSTWGRPGAPPGGVDHHEARWGTDV